MLICSAKLAILDARQVLGLCTICTAATSVLEYILNNQSFVAT